MKFYKRNGYEDTTVRTVENDNGKAIGVIGTVKDLVKVGIFEDCSDDCDAWAAVPFENNGVAEYITGTRDEAIETLYNL